MTAIMPTGVKKPEQKASVEGTVGKVASAIIAKLRNKAYFSFEELKIDVSREPSSFNEKPFQKHEDSRKEIFEEEKNYLRENILEEEQHLIFELIERRHNSTSTIFCTQYRKENWHARLGGEIHADAIMDRIVHNAVWVETGSMNMREYYSKQNNIR